MKYIKLYNTSLELSNICLGGGNFIDTANVYCKWLEEGRNCSEEIIGKWLKSRNAYSKVIIATKGGHYDFATPNISRITKREIQKDMDESLKSLGIDCIDFYWLHRDDETRPIEEIVDMMEGFVKEGKIRYYGASNYSMERMKKAYTYTKENVIQGFSAVSNKWSLASENINLNADPSLVSMTDKFYEWHNETQMPSIPYSSAAFGFYEKLFRAQPSYSPYTAFIIGYATAFLFILSIVFLISIKIETLSKSSDIPPISLNGLFVSTDKSLIIPFCTI